MTNQVQDLTKLRCPGCMQDVGDYAATCANCNTDLLKNDPRTPEVLAKSINRNEQSTFFNVSLLKLFVMSTVTFGLYEIFWFYKNWTYVKEHTHQKMLPFVRALFSPLWYFALLAELNKASAARGLDSKLSVAVIGFGYLALCASNRLPSVFGLLGFLSPLLLFPAQKCINQMNTNSPTPINDRFSGINWVAIIIGGALFLLSVVGTFLPDK